MFVLRIMGLVNDNVDEGSAGQFLVKSRGGESTYCRE
jgi:hypothetical protein